MKDLKLIIKWFRYLYYFYRLSKFEDYLTYNCYYENFNNTKRLTLWYMASKDLDYSFYKVYYLWGIDNLTKEEKSKF